MTIANKRFRIMALRSMFAGICVLVGCSVVNKVSNASAKEDITGYGGYETVVGKDSATKTIPALKLDFKRDVKDLVKANKMVDVTREEAIRINFEWQRRYMRIADTARNRGLNNLYIVGQLKEVNRRLDASENRSLKSDAKADKFYQGYQQNAKTKKTLETAKKSDNITFWMAAGVIILSFGISNLQHYKTRQKIERTYGQREAEKLLDAIKP